MAALGEEDAEAVVAAAVAKAKAGDGAMLRCLVQRILPIARSRPVSLEVPDGREGDLRAVLDATLRGLSQGEILPDEALMIAQALEKAARALAKAPGGADLPSPENNLYPPAEPALAATSSHVMAGLPHPEEPPSGGVSKGPAIRGPVSGAKRRRPTPAARISRLEKANPWMPGSSPGTARAESPADAPSPANRLYSAVGGGGVVDEELDAALALPLVAAQVAGDVQGGAPGVEQRRAERPLEAAEGDGAQPRLAGGVGEEAADMGPADRLGAHDAHRGEREARLGVAGAEGGEALQRVDQLGAGGAGRERAVEHQLGHELVRPHLLGDA
jgi:hypothetical protein